MQKNSRFVTHITNVCHKSLVFENHRFVTDFGFTKRPFRETSTIWFHKMIVLGAPSKTVFLWNACPKKDDFVTHIGDLFHKIVFLEGAVSQNRLFGGRRFTKSSFWNVPFHKIVFLEGAVSQNRLFGGRRFTKSSSKCWLLSTGMHVRRKNKHKIIVNPIFSK